MMNYQVLVNDHMNMGALIENLKCVLKYNIYHARCDFLQVMIGRVRNIEWSILISMLHSHLHFGSRSSYKNVNILVTGECEAQVISKRQICVCKHWASPSCFQRTGVLFCSLLSFPLSEMIPFLPFCFC
jgi:hypothetical protein